MTTQNSTCPIWGKDFEAQLARFPQTNMIQVWDSPRAAGGFQIDYGLYLGLVSSLSDREKARLTTWLVDQRQQGNSHPEVTREIIDLAKTKRPLPAHDRAERLLRFLGRISTTIAEWVSLDPQRDSSQSPIFLEALAWSESARSQEYTEVDELLYLKNYLRDNGWVEDSHGRNSYTCRLTVDGYSRISEQESNLDSSQAFVAMWFDSRMDEAYEQGIELAVKDAGYKPLRIDRKPDVNKIDDEIIAEIRKSRFLVADFTQGEDGARGGVYFEAGFALGLNLRVIYTCRRDMVDRLAFDTRQYNHILWDTPEDLRLNLKNRILALIGEGSATP